jgi:hypothetical protein
MVSGKSGEAQHRTFRWPTTLISIFVGSTTLRPINHAKPIMKPSSTGLALVEQPSRGRVSLCLFHAAIIGAKSGASTDPILQ